MPIRGGTEAADRELRSRLETYLDDFGEESGLSGTVLVASGGRVLYERAFGMADHELGVANTVATMHGIGSVTKLLTAILTLELADEGVLDLDDPLSAFVGDFPNGEAITVDHLLRHRSGIPHRVTSDADVSEPRTAAGMVELARRAGSRFEPGSERGYSSAGYSVLVRVLEVATGRSYGELLREKLLVPAGAIHTVSDDGWSAIPGRSDDHVMGPEGPIPARPANLSFLVGAGSVFSTPRELFAVLRAVDEGVYGDLVRSEVLGDEGELAWNGQTFGYRAFVDYWAEDGRAVVFAGNLHTGAPDLIRRDLPRLLSGEDVPPPPHRSLESVRLSSSEVTEIEGVYQFRAGEPDSEEFLRFSPDGTSARLGSWVLIPSSPDRLFSTTDYGTLSVIRDGTGSVRALEWRRDDAFFELPRVRGLP